MALKNSSKTNWPITFSIFVLIFSPVVALITQNLSLYSLILAVPFVGFWFITKISKKELGLRFTKPYYFVIGILYPIIIQGVIAVIALLLGIANFSAFNLKLLLLALLVDSSITTILLIITEEGVFRGITWGLLERKGASEKTKIIWTSALFALWHIPVLTLFQEFEVTGSSLLFYLLNAFFVGMMWAKIREKSGSIIPLAISHAVWNTLAYVLFGYGKNAQMLGISQQNISIFDPERGLLGVVLNIIGFFVIFLLLNKKFAHK